MGKSGSGCGTLRRRFRFFALSLIITLSLSLANLPTARAQPDRGVVTITGTVRITNPSVIEHLSTEDAIQLVDLTAFVRRDREYRSTIASQPITAIEGDITSGARYTLPLPIEPRGELNDVSNGQGASGSQGVRIYAVSFETNFFGDIFNDPYESGGWPSANSSLRSDPGTGEVKGGMLLIWSPGESELFPAGFGPDGLLFTADDPLTPVRPGWTAINMEASPFEQLRAETVEVPIIEGDTGSTDLSKLSYTEAFDALIADLRIRYALSELKQIDYDELIRDFRPAVERAEIRRDAELFRMTIYRLAGRFRDGHVSSSVPRGYLAPFVGGVGLTLGETDDGVVIARRVSSAAARAGIRRGAVILEWDGLPVQEALADVEIPVNYSSDRMRRLGQVSFLTRLPVNKVVQVRYQNPGSLDVATVRLTATQDLPGLIAALPFSSLETRLTMPVVAEILPSGIGYIKISTFSENPQLLVQTWEWALKTFTQREVPALIVDMRQNAGGFGILPVYFAGSFFKEEFTLYTSYRADKDGNFIKQSSRKIRPAPVQWEKPVAVLIGPECASACETFAAALARNPANLIVGSYPTFGIAAGLFGPWLLPGNVRFNAPVIQPRSPDGRIFVENVGVEPTLKVPVTVESLLSDDDQELPVAENALREIVDGR